MFTCCLIQCNIAQWLHSWPEPTVQPKQEKRFLPRKARTFAHSHDSRKRRLTQHPRAHILAVDYGYDDADGEKPRAFRAFLSWQTSTREWRTAAKTKPSVIHWQPVVSVIFFLFFISPTYSAWQPENDCRPVLRPSEINQNLQQWYFPAF